jgi:SPP1 family phage portal protein
MDLGIEKYIKRFNDYRVNELPRLQKLFNYYDNNQPILSKPNRTSYKNDTKIASGYPEYISTITTAYFIGKNIAYSADEDKEAAYKKIADYLATEEEQKTNYEIALNCSIFGKGYELLYIDETLKLKHKSLDPRDVFVIRDNTIDKNIIGAIRFGINKITSTEYEVTLAVYDNLNVTTYQYIATDPNFTAKDLDNAKTPISRPKPHGFNKVPIIEYSNNKNQKGDFENVITLIDAYNVTVSTSVDDLTDFSDSYLVLTNMGGTDENDIQKMKENKVMLINDDGDAKWLIKQVNDTYSQNVKDRINNDIHKFSFTPDMTDEKFSGNTSGVALEFKLLPLEQLGSQKEMYFKESLNKRLQLIIDHVGADIKPIEIQKIFTRNLPKNIKEISEVMRNLSGIMSSESIISLFPNVEDAKKEIEKKKAEEEVEEYDEFFDKKQTEDELNEE